MVHHDEPDMEKHRRELKQAQDKKDEFQELKDENYKLKQIILRLLTSFENYQLQHKSEDEMDEYDLIMSDYWKEARKVVGFEK